MGKDMGTAEVVLAGTAASGPTEQPGLDVTVDSGGAEGIVGTGLAVADGGHGLARRDQRGMVSAEWAVGIVAAIAIAGVLLAVVTNGAVTDALLKFILWVIQMFTTIANERP